MEEYQLRDLVGTLMGGLYPRYVANRARDNRNVASRRVGIPQRQSSNEIKMVISPGKKPWERLTLLAFLVPSADEIPTVLPSELDRMRRSYGV